VLNPLRSEREAFRFLLYVAVVVMVILGVVALVRAL
jgi:cytoskeletal protein RodZ